MKTFGKIILGILGFVGILALVFGLNLLFVAGAYWLICLILGLSFSWKYAIVFTIILLVLESFLKASTKKNNN